MKLNRYLLGSTLVAALGSLLFGFDTAVISGTTVGLKQTFQLTGFLLGFTVASAILGTIVGSLAAGKPADAFGRKPVLLCLAVLYFVSALGCAACRGTGGRCWRCDSWADWPLAGPRWQRRCTLPRFRPRRSAAGWWRCSQLNVVIGRALGLPLQLRDRLAHARRNRGLAVDAGHHGRARRRCSSCSCCSFPRARAGWSSVTAATRPSRCSTTWETKTPGDVLDKIVESLHEETVAADEPFFRRKYLAPILFAFMVATFNQFTGINALTYYTASIFVMAGAGRASSLLQSVIIGFTQLIFTMIAMSVIDRFGRKNS